MSAVCEHCQKSPMSGNNVSHSHRKTRRRWLPNIQKVTLTMNSGVKKTMHLCTRCIRTFNKKGTL